MINKNANWYLVSIVLCTVALVGFVIVKGYSGKLETKPAEFVTAGNYTTVCLDGVLYWKDHRRLAPYIDKETLTYKRCEVAK